MLWPPLGKLEKQPEVLPTVLHIVLHLHDYSDHCNLQCDLFERKNHKISRAAIAHLCPEHLDQVCQDCCGWTASTTPVLCLVMLRMHVQMKMKRMQMMMKRIFGIPGQQELFRADERSSDERP